MNLDAALDLLSRQPEAPLDLAELALYLARDEYPDLDVEAYLHQINGMAHEVRHYLQGGDLPTLVTRFCRYLFLEMGFRGNAKDYYDPRNSYLNEVLERRTGIPITLSVIAITVGQRAGLEVQGIGLPGHFIAKAVRGEEEVLFDPYHGGRRLSGADCEILVHQLTRTAFQANPESLKKTPLAWILLRMLNNLRGIYTKREDHPRCIRVLERMCRLHPADPSLRRDLGVALVQAGQPGRALDHLRHYLQSKPEPEDAEAIRGLLHRASGEVARWN